MQTKGIKEGDIVHCDVRGQRFFARINRRTDQVDRQTSPGFWVDGLNGRTPPSRIIKARQIVGHYSKRKGSV